MRSCNAAITFAIAFLAAGASLFPAAANEADASAGATIIQPISIMAWEEMLFGTIAPSVTVADHVAIDAAGIRTCGTQLSCLGGTYRAAKFSVTGASNALYTISLPSSVTLSNGSGATMQIHNLTTPLITRQLIDGYDEFMVGAVLDIGANQPTGSYSAAYVVSVDYS